MPSPTVVEPVSAQGLLVARLAEQALAAAEDDGEDHQAQLVDEVALEQPLDQLGAAVDEDLPVHRCLSW